VFLDLLAVVEEAAVVADMLPMDHQAHLAQMANLVVMDSQANLVTMVLLETQLHLNNNPTGASIANLDPQDLPETLAVPANLAILVVPVNPDLVADKAHLDLPVHLDHLETPVNLAALANLDNPVKFAKFPAQKDHPDLPAHLDNPETMDNLATPETLVVPDNPDLQEMLEDPDNLVPPVNLDIQVPMENLVVTDLATTAHLLVLLPDIKPNNDFFKLLSKTANSRNFFPSLFIFWFIFSKNLSQ